MLVYRDVISKPMVVGYFYAVGSAKKQTERSRCARAVTLMVSDEMSIVNVMLLMTTITMIK